MIDATIKAYATRQLGNVCLALVLTGGLVAFTAASSARTPSVMPGTPRISGGSAQNAPRAAPIVGRATVTDGDTLIIEGIRVRLEGIDAPEASQICLTRFGHPWPCGVRATALLARLVEGRTLACEDKGFDKYGRTLAVCFVGGLDINAEMVRQGFAWAFVRYSKAYVGQEDEARARRAGVWDGEAVPAWDYRAGRWQAAVPAAPAGCAIKGNITASGRIYHMPWSPWYDKVKMETERGKRWFCSEAEALAAGWRPANFH